MSSPRDPALEHDHSPDGIADRLSATPSVSYRKDAIDGAVTTFAATCSATSPDWSLAQSVLAGRFN